MFLCLLTASPHVLNSLKLLPFPAHPRVVFFQLMIKTLEELQWNLSFKSRQSELLWAKHFPEGVILNMTYPLCVTRHCLRPSLRKMSTTISIGVWSVTVNGLISRMLRSFNGRGLSAGSVGACWVKWTLELLTMPSCFLLEFSERRG